MWTDEEVEFGKKYKTMTEWNVQEAIRRGVYRRPKTTPSCYMSISDQDLPNPWRVLAEQVDTERAKLASSLVKSEVADAVER